MRRMMIGLAASAMALTAATGPQPPAHPPVPKPATEPAAAPDTAASAKKAGIDQSILHVQVVLDRLGFSPGILDGRPGQSLSAALKGFQESRGLPGTGQMDAATQQALAGYQSIQPTVSLTMTPEALAGPFTPDIPHGEDAQAKLSALAYKNPMEKLAEMFHTEPAVITALNPPGIELKPGGQLVVPNIKATNRNYDAKLPDHWRATLAMLNVDANQPQAGKVVVSKSQKVLRVFDGSGKLVAQFGVTTGSKHDPLPIGNWKITGADYNPPFHYNPALFWDARKGDKKATLPPGPNGPVGVVWLNLTKPHYGIHGTPEPQLIGRTESHGCVRLANWNAARLAMMVKPGTPLVFEE